MPLQLRSKKKPFLQNNNLYIHARTDLIWVYVTNLIWVCICDVTCKNSYHIICAIYYNYRTYYKYYQLYETKIALLSKKHLCDMTRSVLIYCRQHSNTATDPDRPLIS